MKALAVADHQRAVAVVVISKPLANLILPQNETVTPFVSKVSLKALTAAALCLPGLIQTPAYAGENEAVTSYGHYQEGARNLYGATSAFKPIEVDSLMDSGHFEINDRLRLNLNYSQDTWGGATPIASSPLAFGGNGGFTGSNASDLTSGATPYLTNSSALFDNQLNPIEKSYNADGDSTYKVNNQVVDTMSLASPETRQQGDFNLGYTMDNSALEIGGGSSIERDYNSYFGNINSIWDFNQKLTTVNIGQSYTNSYTHATVNHDASPYIIKDPVYDPVTTSKNDWIGNPTYITGTREDWATTLGLTQVINKNALLQTGFGFTRGTGYMANPYKTVSIATIDPTDTICDGADQGYLCANVNALLEQRPTERNQFNGNLRYVQHLDFADAATHVGYRFFSDDWGITSHTLDADWAQPLPHGWMVTPSVRYYSQNAANFYTPYLVTFKDSNSKNGINRNNLPTYYSSDYRLAGYGALSGGIAASKFFAKGIALDVGFEYYTHQSALRLGGGQNNSFNNMDYWTVNAAMKVDLGALAMGGSKDHAEHLHHDHGAHAPAGVMYDHMLPKAGDMMVGYRYMYGSQSGDMLNGTQHVNNQAVVDGGCGPNPCYLKPASMSMDMHMLEFMYAPADWLTLMVMPQFVDMTMKMNRLRGPEFDPVDPETGEPTAAGSHITHHLQNEMQAGGLSDVGMFALFKLFDNGTHHVHITAGLSAPVGDVNLQLSRNHQVDGGYADYGMQLGSGTWDWKPSMTYTGHINQWSWGAQSYGTIRMQNQNESGYALGDLLQNTAWGTYNFTNWLATSVRGLYTLQGGVNGQFNGLINQLSPTDYPTNYGGKYLDVGLGLSATVPSGIMVGNRLSVEWMQPVQDNVNGYQLERNGTIYATWGLNF